MMTELSRRELFAAVGGLVLSPTLLESLESLTQVAEKEIESVEDTINKVLDAEVISYTLLSERPEEYDLLRNDCEASPAMPESMRFGEKLNALADLNEMCEEVFVRTGKIPQNNYIIFYKECTGVVCSFHSIKSFGRFDVIGFGNILRTC